MSVESLDSIPRSRAVWRFPIGMLLLVAAVGALSLLPFWDALVYMWNIWLTYPEYSHGLLIPPIAGFLIWQQKDRLELLGFEGSWAGVVLVVVGAALLLLGQLSTLYILVEYAYLVTLFGLILAWMGTAAFRLIVVPLCILFFMIPLPDFILHNLSTQLQLVSSQLGVWFIRLFGISVFLEGNVIDLGGYQLQVAEACSGLRYLFPLMTIGFLMAYFYKGATWKRITLFLSSVPITVAMNSIRIGTIGVMVEHWGTAMAEGFLHEFQGWVVFMVSAVLMLGEIALLNRFGREAGTWRELFGVQFPAPSPVGAPRKPRVAPPAFMAALAVLIATAGASLWLPRPVEITPNRDAFVDFPMSLGSWSGHRGTLDREYLDVLKLDDYLLADYSTAATSAVNLYIAYYASQRKGEAVHSPRSCLPGGGWQFRDFGQRTLDGIEINGHPLRVNRTIIELGERRQLVYYWFEQRGRVITNEIAVKWFIFWDALTRNRTDGALVRVITEVPRGGSESDADARLVDIARHLTTALPRFVPN